MNLNIKNKKCIYFDLDGTLIDSKEGITKSIQFALNKMELSPLTADELERCIGPVVLKNSREKT
jgi:phosphoglycolate phosphatase